MGIQNSELRHIKPNLLSNEFEYSKKGWEERGSKKEFMCMLA